MATSGGGKSSFGCPLPFLPSADFPYKGGELAGRFCRNITGGQACCLPCPSQEWIYSDAFPHNLNIAYWLNVPALVLQVFLLLTFVVLPVEVSHRHHLSVGLCISLIMIELCFIIALGTKPNLCYDKITPRDMYTSMSCAWSGAFLVAGAMGCAVWIMLRSLWTHLRVCWDVRQTKTLFYLTQAIGWGLPGLFLALTIPITGVSYRVGPACVPNQKNAFLTWFGWLISFACLAALLQFVTTFFCLWLYLKDVFWGTSLTGTRMSEMETTTSTKAPTTVTSSDRKLAWKRVRKVLSLQWRSIVLTTLVIVEVVFFSVVFIHETSTALRLSSHQTDEIVTWAVCLITHLGRKEECLSITKILGLSEARIIASFMLAALIGYLTFALMLRRSMLRGWLDLLLHPRRRRRTSIGEEAFIIVSPKRKSFGRQLESEKPQPLTTTTNVDRDGPLLSPVSPMSPIAPSAVLPEVLNTLRGEPHRNLSIPRPGDVDRRHGTTNWFDEEEQGGDEGHRRVSRVSRLDDIP